MKFFEYPPKPYNGKDFVSTYYYKIYPIPEIAAFTKLTLVSERGEFSSFNS